MITEQWIEVQGIKIHLLQAGETGSPVVLLHGGGTDSARLSWEPAMQALAPEHRVFAADYPGFGDSDKLDKEYTIESYILFLEALLDRLEVDKAGLAGISLGGSVGLGFTLAHPERVDRLALTSSYGLQKKAPAHLRSYLFLRVPFLSKMSWAAVRKSRRMARLGLEAIFYDHQAITDELLDQVYKEMQKPDNSQAWTSIQKSEVTRKGVRTYFMDRIHEITAPTLIIHGDRDSLAPLDCAIEAYKRLPDARLRIMKDCGHWPQREKPEEFNRILGEFFRAE
jgi:pimeloyl-ACP methyl ester carboxylesterase